MKIVDLIRGDLTKLERATLGALVVMDVHACDVVTNLVKDGVTALSDFAWQAQLRTYWEADEEVQIRVVAMPAM
jgi:dynein heavy chain